MNVVPAKLDLLSTLILLNVIHAQLHLIIVLFAQINQLVSNVDLTMILLMENVSIKLLLKIASLLTQ